MNVKANVRNKTATVTQQQYSTVHGSTGIDFSFFIKKYISLLTRVVYLYIYCILIFKNALTRDLHC